MAIKVMSTTRGAFVVLSLLPVLAYASPQQQATAGIQPAFGGDCAVVVSLTDLRPGDRVQIELDSARLRTQTVPANAKEPLKFATGDPLGPGDSLQLRVNGESRGAGIKVGRNSDRPKGAEPAGSCDPEEPAKFTGTSFEASGYLGWAFDQFAPASVAGYPDGTATKKSNRYLFGVNFDYRVLGGDDTPLRLWLSGETLHGVRSADVDCTAEENKPPICDDALSTGKIRAVLAEATSIEAYLAPRVDLWRAQKDGSTHAQLYFSPRFGFIALADAPRVYQNFHVGVGLMAEDSVFEGSVFEIGWGNNELLSGKAWKRLKIDGYLSVNLDKVPWFGDKGNFFIQMFIDNDLGESSADSIQTFMGFNFDFRKLSGR